ncbi:MAG: TerC family protein [Rhodovibrionaceae bacterium]|nr:TerC family protein [Rhodovibrionaceae bacterium]
MLEWLANPEIWISFLSIAILEIVLGIDNLIFLSIVTERLPAEQQPRARKIGLILALVGRIGLLFAITWVIGLTRPIFEVMDLAISWRDILLLAGGLFLIAKATTEIHAEVEGQAHAAKSGDNGGAAVRAGTAAFAGVMLQVIALDIVFSLDSVLTAVGMTREIPVMVAAIVVAILVMIFAAEPVANFVQRHPTMKMLALSFLLLIGTTLVADGLHFEIPKGYVYFAVLYAVLVEALNWLRGRRRRKERAA